MRQWIGTRNPFETDVFVMGWGTVLNLSQLSNRDTKPKKPRSEEMICCSLTRESRSEPEDDRIYCQNQIWWHLARLDKQARWGYMGVSSVPHAMRIASLREVNKRIQGYGKSKLFSQEKSCLIWQWIWNCIDRHQIWKRNIQTKHLKYIINWRMKIQNFIR